MSTKSFTLNDFNVTDEDLKAYFKGLQTQQANTDINVIFELNLLNKSLFPKINLSSNATWKDYLSSWIAKFNNADKLPPSKKVANPSGAPSDYLVSKIVQTALNLPSDKLDDIQKYHALAMQVENIQGGLLEEYIASKVSKCNWIWCKGETVKSVDFCTKDCKTLLQIKNKYNTENSSSSNIRQGTTIEKWYRLGKKIVSGKPVPIFRWDNLNKIIKDNGNGLDPKLSEKDFEKFIVEVVSKNQKIIIY